MVRRLSQTGYWSVITPAIKDERRNADKSFRLENAENSQNAQNPDELQISRARHNQADIRRQNGEQIDDAVKTPSVGHVASHAQHSQSIFDRKQESKAPVNGKKRCRISPADAADAFQQHYGNA